MATRNGVPLDIVWVHARVGPPGPALVESELRFYLDAKQDEYPGLEDAVISIIKRSDNSEWLVKCPNATVAYIESSPSWVTNKVIRIFTEADHDEAKDLLNSGGWAT